VTDASGRVVCFTKQKPFKFKEHVEIFNDKSKTTLLAEIKTKKVIDWSARYHFTDATGNDLGSVGRRGWRSIWRAHYEVFNPGDDNVDYSIREENPASKFFDGLFGGIPVIGMASGYLFHPRYAATKTGGNIAMRMTKKAAFFEGRFEIEKLEQSLTHHQELNLVLSYMMMVLLERKRGQIFQTLGFIATDHGPHPPQNLAIPGSHSVVRNDRACQTTRTSPHSTNP